VPLRQRGLELLARHGDSARAALAREEGRVDGDGVDTVGVHDDQEVVARQTEVVEDGLGVSRRALDGGASQRTACEHDATIEHGVDGHEAAGAEEDFLGAHGGVTTAPQHEQQAVGGDGVGHGSGRIGDGPALLVEEAVHETTDLGKVALLQHGAPFGAETAGYPPSTFGQGGRTEP
jgi:hypothetical protein